MKFHARNDIHLARRIWHLCGVLIIGIIYFKTTTRQAAILAISFSTFMVGFDTARLFSQRLNRLFTWVFAKVLRESERNSLSGSTHMMAGVTLIILLFPRSVVLLTLLFLATADPAASYFGIRFGKDKLVGNKSFQGTAAAFVTCFLVSTFYYTAFDLMAERRFIVCLLSAFVGAVSELMPVGRMDDNFVFPVVCASLLTGLYYVFGGF